ncbi:MAG: pyridoxamine 5'-phosphate oxidase family protein [Planctomycetes bacterium]|nr:pyridoxamine 5'-phosphate oxidase family protein [Planctomycetota bacterium]
MSSSEILQFIKDNPVFYLATCIDNEPRVRVMRLYQAGGDGIIFNTSSRKSLHKQLQANPAVELCFYDDREGMQVRIRGKVQLVEDPKVRNEMVENNPVLAAVVFSRTEEGLAIYRLRKGRAKVWKMDEYFQLKLMSNVELSSIWMAMYDGANAHSAH